MQVDFNQLISVANDRSLDRDDLKAVIDAEFSHDIETEEEAQQAVLKDIERVTGARSVAVTRYGSYEAKLHGRNSLGVIKQGEFDAIGETEADNAARRRAQVCLSVYLSVCPSVCLADNASRRRVRRASTPTARASRRSTPRSPARRTSSPPTAPSR